MTDFSQSGEQKIILDHFGARVGTFLDIGAYDGVTFSNTRALALKGWKGTLVEPMAHAFAKLFDLYRASDPNDIDLVNCAIVAEPSTRLRGFYYSPDTGVSSLRASHAKDWDAVGKYRLIMIRTLAIADLARWDVAPTFVTIDAEGESWAIARALLNCGESIPELICVEHEASEPETLDGYQRIAYTANNTIWKRA